jgi:hypothetical protein
MARCLETAIGRNHTIGLSELLDALERHTY